MATYSNIGIKLITTGDESGTWGTSTNTNFSDVLDEAIAGAVTYNISSDADFTLTVSDGTSSDARHAVIKFTSTTLTATRTCTFAPNDLQKTWVVINATTGGQSLIFKQGSAGATVTVPNGESAIIYSDGGGASAGAITRVLDSFTNTKITTGTLNATTLDLTNLEVTNIKAKDGTAAASIADSTGIVSLSANPILSGGTANGVLYLDGSKVATSGSALTFDGNGAVISVNSSSDALRITQVGSGNALLVEDSANPDATPTVIAATGNVGIGTTSPATNLSIIGTGIPDAGSVGAYQVSVDNNAAYNANPQGGIIHRFKWSSAGTLTTGAGIRFYKPNTNDSDASSQIGFIVRSGISAQSQAMTLDSSGNLGIGTTSPASRLDVRNTGGTYDKGISIQTASAGNIGTIWTSLTDLNIGIAGAHKFTNFDGSATRMTLDSSGNLGLGVTPSAWNTGALQIRNASFWGLTGLPTFSSVGANYYYDGTYKYISTAQATDYYQFLGQHLWRTAASGTAGNAITFTTAMTLDASGNLTVANGDITIGTNGKKLYTNYIANNSGTNLNFDAANFLFNTGNVGIGTTSPSTRLHAKGTGGTIATFERDASGTIAYFNRNAGSGNAGAIIGADSVGGYFAGGNNTNNMVYLDSVNNVAQFFTNNAERARITAGGNLLVGTTTDVSGLTGVISDVSGNVRAIPQSGSDKTTSYTLVKSDVGKFIGVGSGGSITVPDATFATGDVVSIFNNTTGNVTLTMTITTAYIGGTNTDKATITLATRGVATILFISGTVCVVNGNVS